MALTPEQIAVLQARLAEAEAAYHAWRIGSHARTFHDSNGERIEYSVEAMRGLPGYIADLKRQLDSSTVSGPMRGFF